MRPSPSQWSSETSRQAARREKSLNKIPAMQRVAMALEQASSSPLSAKSEVEVPGIKKSIEVGEDSDAGVGFATGALPPLLPLTNGAFQNAVEDTESDIHPDFVAPPSSHPRHSSLPASSDETTPRSEDEDGGVSTDVFADFDIPSEADRAFLRAHLREAPKEDVTFLLNTRKASEVAIPVHMKSIPSTPKPQAGDILPGTPRSLLKYHQRRDIIVAFAKNHAADTIPGTPDASQLKGFLLDVETFASGLGLGPNQALFEAQHAQEDLCKARGIKSESKLATLEMPGLELTDAIEVLANVQQTVGNLFGDKGVPQNTGAAQNATPTTKRKRFRKDANTPKVESDIGGTPLREAATTDSQPEKVILNDRRSKRQKANIAAVAAEAEFAKLNPGAPKLSKRERKIAFIQNKAKEAANTLAAAPATAVVAEAVAAEAVAAEVELSEVDSGTPKLTRRERRVAFIQEKAKAASAIVPAVAPTTVIAATVTAKAESAEVESEAPKLTKRERKAAFIQNKAKEASAIIPPAAPATVIAPADTQADPATNTQPPQVDAKEHIALPAISPLGGDATASDAGTSAAPKSKKMQKKEERKAKRALGQQVTAIEPPSVAAGGSPAPPKPVVAMPTEQVANAAAVPTTAAIKAGNEVATAKPSKKRNRGAKNKPIPGAGDPASANTAPVASQTKPTAAAVNKPTPKVAAPILPPAIKPPTVAVPNAPKPVVAADDGFIDLRAPKKKKRARKSTTATDANLNANTSEPANTDVIIKPEAIAPAEAVNTQPEAEAKPIVQEEANGDVGMNAAGKRKRKRSAQQAKKASDINEPITAIAPVAVAVSDAMELCVDEPASKPVAAPIIPATQPLSEIPAPNPVSNKRRKRGNRKSIGDENKTEAPVAVGSQDPASGGQPLEVAGQTMDISRRESSSPITGTVGVERGLGESKVKKEIGVMLLDTFDEAMVDGEVEPLGGQGAETDGEAKVSAYTLSIPSEADSDESREGSALNEFDRRVTRSASRERISIDAAETTASTKQPEFKYDKFGSSTPPLGDSSDEADNLESPTRPKLVHPRRNSVILPRLAQSPNKSLLQPPEPATAVTLIKKEKAITKSPYFSPAVSPKKPPRSPGGVISCIPFPPLSSPSFGLLQEKLRHDPLRLLIGVTFLIRTYGKSSIPIYYKLMELFPTATELANADKDVIIELTRHLGLQSVRADTYIRYARTFLDDPPVKGKRYRVENYPTKGAHSTIKKGEVLSDDDMREGAWEIGHLTKGPYAIDSWRIFCRDELRGLAKGWNGEEAKDEGFQPEWMRVLPKDKELRAFLRWCWLREGWVWDAETGEREVAGKELVCAVNDGRVVWEWKGKDGKGDWRILGKHESIEKEEAVDVKREVE
ncbi:hypothetical protein VE03_00414 [Pseudogymnoascus sp. 23342-1-I1]|nr:hypothetical protein VE03_00414 [Pseudogymnoascus sp. 23342-1-I1]